MASTQRWLAAVLFAATQSACGSAVVDERGAERTCPPQGLPHFERVAEPWECLQTDGADARAFDNRADWEAFWAAHDSCDIPAPSLDFDDAVAIAVILESGCNFTGCQSVVPIVSALRIESCVLEVTTTRPSQQLLGDCRACVQPRDIVTVARQRVEGIDEVVFRQRAP
jgi:hypothetical protein